MLVIVDVFFNSTTALLNEPSADTSIALSNIVRHHSVEFYAAMQTRYSVDANFHYPRCAVAMHMGACIDADASLHRYRRLQIGSVALQ